jgi:cell division protein FtsB
MLKQSLEDEMKVAKKELADAKTGVAAAEEAKSVADGDLEVTSKDLAGDVKELNDAHHGCQSTAEDFEAAVTERGEELKALAEAKKVISESTGAAETLTYGLDQVSFLQRRQQSSTEQGGANFAVVRFVRGLARKQGSTQLAQFANRLASTIRFSARVGQDPFAKVKGLISELIESLEASAEADASHKAYCDKETKETTEKKADKSSEVAKLTTAIDKMTARIATLEEEVAELQKELANLAKAQTDYQAWFTKAEETYTTNKADIAGGLEGVKKALQVLGDYYAKGGANEGAGSGIIGLLEVVESDFSKGLTETEAGFTEIKMEFEASAKEAELTTATKDQDVKYKSEEITSLKKSLGETTSDRKGVQSELDAILEYLGKINEMCIAKAEPYAEKKARREAEIAGLKEALSVLEGEAVLLQRGSRRAMRASLRGVERHFAA